MIEDYVKVLREYTEENEYIRKEKRKKFLKDFKEKMMWNVVSLLWKL